MKLETDRQMSVKFPIYATKIHQIWSKVIPSYSQQDAMFLDLFISKDALHVTGCSSAHHQEHITLHTASGIVNQYCCLLLPWRRWNCFPSPPR